MKNDQNESRRALSSLPAERAFAVRFKAASGEDGTPFAGRIEHVRSGRALTFGSPAELVRRLADLLVEHGGSPLVDSHPRT